MDSDVLRVAGWGVFFASMVVVLLPIALYDTPYRKSTIFIGIPPMGNNTISGNMLLVDNRLDVMVMQLNGDLCAHIVCILAAIEACLLWFKTGCIQSDVSPYTYSNVLRHGGVYTANNEFWLFVAVQHVLITMVVVSPVSIHALLLLVFLYVSLISTLCEPENDTHEESESDMFSEKRVNHVAAIYIYGGLTFILIAVDQRLNGTTFKSIGVGSGAFFIQMLFDLLLVMVHASPQTSLFSCYLWRLVYVFACACSVIWWMIC
jgi:hypothetical protein